MKFSYVAAGVLVLALALWMASGAFSSNSSEIEQSSDTAQNDATAPMKVEYIDVQLSPKSRDIVLQGQLEPKRHLQMRAETSSTVKVISVGKGQSVKKGDTILNLSLAGRRTDLQEAQAQLKSATSQQKAAESLRQKGLQSQLQLEQSQAALAAARAQLDRTQRDIAYTRITAPFTGVINNVPVEVGEMIDRGAIVAEIVDNSGFIVSAQVAQQTLAQLELGKSIEVKLITGDVLSGKLIYISSVADTATRSFTVEAEVDNIDGKYAAGVSASMIVPIEQVEAVFLSPSAIALGDSGDIGVKTIDENQQVVFTPIKLISTSLDGAWVTGIPDGSRVITLGQGFVKTGQTVDPVAVTAPSKEAS